MNFQKVYVDVTLRQDKEGNTRPLSLVFGERTYEIDRVKDIRRAASTKVGGSGIRYTIMISGRESFLYEDEGKWFVEAKKQGAET
jgi:hypothetical protein